MASHLRVVAFDLDDTLAVSKSEISREMADHLTNLLRHVEVCIISGGRFEQFQKQVLAHLELVPALRTRLHLMPTSGTRYYVWSADAWTPVYAEDFTAEQRAAVIAALTESARELGLWETETWGPIIEDRGSQVTYSALGQQAPPEKKYAWDPDGAKKRQLRDRVAQRLPDLEVRAGGSTSVDVTRKGIDKAFGMRRLMEYLGVGKEDILFVGDSLQEGGNDYPVKAFGIETVSVDHWTETAAIIEKLIAGFGSAEPVS